MSAVHKIFFSPTGTTRKIVNTVAECFDVHQCEDHDLTHSSEPDAVVVENGIAVIGIPVYAGRVPEDCLKRLAAFSAQGIPAVLVALYGNRAFEDALVELRDVVSSQGFRVVAAGAFIGEHSYSTPERPIAAGRPDADDLQCARDFGRQVAAKIAQGDLIEPDIAGNTPYRERVQFGGVAPTTRAEVCTLCGQCVKVCPVKVVSLTDSIETDDQGCIMCCACTRACAFEARIFNHPVLEERRALLIQNCSQAKKPQLFL